MKENRKIITTSSDITFVRCSIVSHPRFGQRKIPVPVSFTKVQICWTGSVTGRHLGHLLLRCGGRSGYSTTAPTFGLNVFSTVIRVDFVHTYPKRLFIVAIDIVTETVDCLRFFKGGRSGDKKKMNNDPDPKTCESKDPMGQLVSANDDIIDSVGYQS